MTLARWRGAEYRLLNVTEDAELVLREEAGDIVLVEEDVLDRVEIRCDHCGRWSTACAPIGSRWVCFDTGCHDAV